MPKRDRKLKLYKALKIGYLRDENKQAKALGRFGYQLDRRISDGRQTMVAYNPMENKVLFVENGTAAHSSKDLQTDMILALGGIKQTKRYEETKNAYAAAKDKYKGAEFVSAGHSLAGGLLNAIVPKGDQSYTYNPAIVGQPLNRNVENYRTRGDVVSLLSPEKNTTQLVNANESTVPTKNYLLKAHAIANIQNLPVFL
jgi:hypothetical protein